MKNVIVFALGGSRYAVELRWVREVVTLGFVTPVPGAPPPIAGVVNLRGTVTPVLDLHAALSDSAGDAADAGRTPRKGDGAIVVEVEAVIAALHVSNVEEVSTLGERVDGEILVDSHGREVPLVDCPEVIRRVMTVSTEAREPTQDAQESEQGGA
jgi:purine-binding chemotaxis protein CheW